MSTSLPRMFTSSDTVTNSDFIDIDYSSLNLLNLPSINANTSGDVNVHIELKTKKTARLKFSATFTGTVHYIVLGFN